MEEWFKLAVEFLIYGWDVLTHLDQHLNAWAAYFGPWLYVILFAIIFCETGLVVTPFLPGDSLLFAVGALSATDGSVINIWLITVLLFIAGVLGDACNYSIGAYFGPKVFSRKESFLFNRDHLVRTQNFYEKYGGKTIIIARFIPIIRTFAPFVAGIGRMNYGKFSLFNVTGCVLWVCGFLGAGYIFGNLPAVKDNFHVVIFAIIFLSILPPIIEFLRVKKK